MIPVDKAEDLPVKVRCALCGDDCVHSGFALRLGLCCYPVLRQEQQSCTYEHRHSPHLTSSLLSGMHDFQLPSKGDVQTVPDLAPTQIQNVYKLLQIIQSDYSPLLFDTTALSGITGLRHNASIPECAMPAIRI